MNTTKDIIRELRIGAGLSQEELAEQIFVTRQAVSRWENGDTVPNTDTLKLLSKFFDVSVNTLLGSPRKLICQCCGMPLDDDGNISREPGGDFNEDYCKWCYTDGEFVYKNIEELTDFLVGHLSNESFPPERQVPIKKFSIKNLIYGTRQAEICQQKARKYRLFLYFVLLYYQTQTIYLITLSSKVL